MSQRYGKTLAAVLLVTVLPGALSSRVIEKPQDVVAGFYAAYLPHRQGGLTVKEASGRIPGNIEPVGASK